jgi:hypothetical protein
MTIEEFIEKCQKRALPNNPMARVKILARELAEGAHDSIWGDHLDVALEPRTSDDGYNIKIAVPVRQNLIRYFQERWDNQYPQLRLLKAHNYVDDKWLLTEKAINLLEEAEQATIFISYKRSESSAFALLMEDRLTQTRLSPFLDKQLQAGDDWQAELEGKIANSDYLILILGNKTLESSVTVKEIEWAIQYRKTIIPIWHNGFAFKAEEWPTLPVEISQALANTHTIRVIEENPLTYDTALRELLNRFGISG